MIDKLNPEILNLVRDGNNDAIAQVKKILWKISYSIFRDQGIRDRLLMKQIVSEVIIEIYARRSPFDETKNINGYLYRVTKNILFRYFREKIPGSGQFEETIKLLDAVPELDAEIALFEFDDAMEYCLTQLNQKERMLIEGLLREESTEDLMKKLGYKSPGVFRTRKCLVLAKFRAIAIKNGVDL